MMQKVNEKSRKFEYFYYNSQKKYTFYQLPKVLFADKFFDEIPYGAKVVYGFLLDRQDLSFKNGWFDDKKRVYILFSVAEIMDLLKISKTTALKFLDELEKVGLIERKRQGTGQPNVIYVKNYINSNEESCRVQKLDPDDIYKCENYTHGVQNLSSCESKKQTPRVKNIDPSDTNINNTNNNNTNTSNIYMCKNEVSVDESVPPIGGVDGVLSEGVSVDEEVIVGELVEDLSVVKAGKANGVERKAIAEQVKGFWNAMAKGAGIPTVTVISKDRERALFARLKELQAYGKGLDDLCRAIEFVPLSDWRLGKNKNSWRANFDWFVRKTSNVLNLLEEGENAGNKPVLNGAKAHDDIYWGKGPSVYDRVKGYAKNTSQEEVEEFLRGYGGLFDV